MTTSSTPPSSSASTMTGTTKGFSAFAGAMTLTRWSKTTGWPLKNRSRMKFQEGECRGSTDAASSERAAPALSVKIRPRLQARNEVIEDRIRRHRSEQWPFGSMFFRTTLP